MTRPAERETCDAILDAYLGGAIRAEIALMRLILATPSETRFVQRIDAMTDRPEPAEAVQPLADLAALSRRHPDAWRTVRGAAEVVPQTGSGASVEATVAELAAGFDAAARISPQASVALYSLGDPGLLAAATVEIVDWMRGAGLLGPERRLLDLGCGAGRLEVALSAEVGRIVGLDISAEMLAIARRRCRGLGAVELRHGSGLDLAGLPDAGFDAVIAVDSFPYIVGLGGDAPARHFAECARVLGTGGALAILNYSYRGSLGRDRAEVGSLGEAAGFRLIENGSRPFDLWDGAASRLVKRQGRSGADQI